jgi:DNA-binding NarL/FixJ family response regulator
VPPKTSVLVVDDHELVRRGICTILASDPTLDVICQTADGEGAVRKAEELQPELILLDINLPGISGVEAARRIRKVSPGSHIIFISQHDTLAVVKQGFSTGAHGYVVKSDAALDVLNAIRAVREGKRFVSGRVLAQGWRPDA